MPKIDMGQALSILANIGVIGGLVFLAIEIQENREQATIANTLQGNAELNLWIRSLADDPNLAELFQKGADSFNQLSKVEQLRFDSLMRSGVMQLSIMNLARRTGLATLAPGQAENRVIEGTLLRLFDNAGVREWWIQADKRGMPLPTRELINASMDKSR